ncbi:helix-turn-helix domain-containing protein [Siphonobacter sp. SORGH_AS_0500]|uniref:helix-turn-helix domain-containing protein n=1 Tax=Siphonobacter sp. SORGH_AS_0500 TaxID=1864824 RepID=UPI002861A8E2|nr:helix-turn-helix domain-containing protein [Siphonobacter sp. SORGH_AS_0500]MDR6195675.1 transcriptional regulator with XRE-family HTH domain [Siphonobacter sp. SORGH_AS_0500]
MDNQKISIGLALKALSKEKKVSVATLASGLNLTRQGIYDTFGKRLSMTTEELDKWAEILGVPVQVILDRANGKVSSDKTKSDDSVNFGTEVVERFEEHFKKMEEFYHEQLRAKDLQIEKLLGLLGKPKGCPSVATLYQLRVLSKKGLVKSPFFLDRGYKFGYTPAYLCDKTAINQ